jgi:signal transduction histidine kinase
MSERAGRVEALGYMVRVAAIALVYVAAGRFGLQLDAVSGFATLVWAPSGIALAALLLLGPRFWPGVAIGAFVVNVWAGAALPVAIGISLGNSLEALVGAAALRRIGGFRTSLDRVADVVGLVMLAGMLATAIAATIGVTVLAIGGVVSANAFGTTWSTWWLGDFIGILVVAPLIMTWAAGDGLRAAPEKWLEALALVTLLVGLGVFIFAAPPPAVGSRFWEPYMLAPVLVWAALRFGTRGTTAAIVLVSAIAIGYTLAGTGPFAAGPVHEDLLFVQTFMAVVAVTYLMLAAAIAERRRTEHERTILLTRELAARTEAEQAEKRSAFLYRATTVLLGNLLEVEVRAELVARLVVSRIADFCLIDVVTSAGDIQRLAAVHRDPEKGRLTDTLKHLAPDLNTPGAIATAIRTGQSVVKTGITDDMLDADTAERVLGIQNAEVLQMMRDLGVRGFASVPLVARERAIGAITVATSDASHSFESRDLRLLEDLALRIALAIDNSRLYRDALVADRAKSDFLAVMSHELRTPLTAIVGYTELLASEISGPLTAKQKEQLGRIATSSNHLRALIDDVLTFSRLELGREDVHSAPSDLGLLVREVAAIAEPLVKGKGLDLLVVVPQQPTRLETDAKMLRQILLNLVSNAVKFTDQGEIELTAWTEDRHVIVQVRDTGIGIAPAHLDKIFEPFWQVEHGPTRTTGGAGLGLSVSRRLARLLGGDLSVESETGKGSVFTTCLPTGEIADVLRTEEGKQQLF